MVVIPYIGMSSTNGHIIHIIESWHSQQVRILVASNGSTGNEKDSPFNSIVPQVSLAELIVESCHSQSMFSCSFQLVYTIFMPYVFPELNLWNNPGLQILVASKGGR